MSAPAIQQLLHGYRNGHQMLAGSLRLKGEAADLVDRLSDLSGAIVPNTKIEPYLTLYPIPQSGFYAVANTWIDPTGPRAGCVLTHTLLVPTALWSTDPDPSWLADCLNGPANHGSIDDYKTPIVVPKEKSLAKRLRNTPISDAERLFTYRFFGEGVRPIVWFDCPAALTLWSVARFLWPSMRQVFSASTLCLQPRMATDGPFHLMFAPSAARPRFQQFPVQSLIPVSSDATANGTPPPGSWVDELAQSIFCREYSGDLELEMSNFAAFLEADPTAIQRLFLVSNLKNRIDSAPMAGIGLLDLLETMMPAPDSGVATKTDALSSARRAAKTGTPVEALRCYFLLSDRLRRPAFQNAIDDIDQGIRSDVYDLVVTNPTVAITEQSSLSLSSLSETPSSYFNGLLDGLEYVAQARPTELIPLRENSDLAVAALQARPMIAVGVMTAAHDNSTTDSLPLAEWIRQIRDRQSRQSLRQYLFPHISHDIDVPVLSELLIDITSDEVFPTLDTLFAPTRAFKLSPARRTTQEHVSERFPQETCDWASNSHNWSQGAADVTAAAFPPNVEGVSSLLAHHFPFPRHVETLTAFLERLGSQHLPNWLIRFAAEDARVIAPFIKGGPEAPSRVTQCFMKVLEACDYIPVIQLSSLLDHIELNTTAPYLELLVNRTMQSVFREFREGRIDLDEHRRWLNQMWAERWIATAPSTYLVQQSTACANSKEWERSWTSIQYFPDVAYSRPTSVIPDIVRSLLRSSVTNWTPDVVESWRTVISRAMPLSDATTRLQLCADAIRFCFYNTDLPLGAVATEAFSTVYSAVVNSRDPLPETSELFRFYDWDKAKTLRKDLLQAYMTSNWNPGGLAIAASRAGLSRKIFSRLSQKWNGRDYVHRILDDLRNHSDQESIDVANALNSMVNDSEFYEPWD